MNQKTLNDTVYEMEFIRIVPVFKHFYPSDLNKMLSDFTPTDKTIIPRLYAKTIRDGIIKKSGRTKKLTHGGIEWEYISVIA